MLTEMASHSAGCATSVCVCVVCVCARGARMYIYYILYRNVTLMEMASHSAGCPTSNTRRPGTYPLLPIPHFPPPLHLRSAVALGVLLVHCVSFE